MIGLEASELESSLNRHVPTGSHAFTIQPTRPSETVRSGSGWLERSSWISSLHDTEQQQPVQLSVPLRINFFVDPDDKGYIVVAPLFQCSGSGETFEEALSDLGQTLLYLRRDLAGDDDSRLTEDAVSLKRRLLRIIP